MLSACFSIYFLSVFYQLYRSVNPVRPVSNAGDVEARRIADFLRVALTDPLLKRRYRIILHQTHRAAAEARSGHAGADHAVLRPGQLGQRIKLPARHIVVVAQRNMRFIHQTAEPRQILLFQRLHRLQRAVVLKDGMPGALAFQLLRDMTGQPAVLLIRKRAESRQIRPDLAQLIQRVLALGPADIVRAGSQTMRLIGVGNDDACIRQINPAVPVVQRLTVQQDRAVLFPMPTAN